MSNYQRLQSEKARNFLENKSKQANRGEQQLQLGGKQLQLNAYQNNLIQAQASPQVAFNTPGTAGRVPTSGEIQKGITLAITRDRDINGNVLTQSRDSNIIDVLSSLGDGIIISKINVVQLPKMQNETSLSSRKGVGITKGEMSIMSDLRVEGPKKTSGGPSAVTHYKYYQTLSNSGDSQAGSQLGPSINNMGHAFRNNDQMPKPASPPPNMDLESIINNSEAYFKNQKGKNRQKPRQLPTLQNLDSLAAYNSQFHKQLLHAQALSSTT